MSEDFSMTNKVVLITGDNYDLSYQIAEEFALEDARIVILSSNEEKAEEIALLLDNEYSIDPMYQRVDLDDEESVEDAIRSIEALYEKVDVIVNTGERGSNEVLLDCLSVRNIYPLFQISKISSDDYHFDMENKVAVVTGASGRIGKDVAQRFASEGAKIVLFSDNEDKLLEDVRRYQNSGVDADYYVTNLDEAENIKESLEAVIYSSGSIDYLANTAGMGENKNIVDELVKLDLKPLFCIVWLQQFSNL